MFICGGVFRAYWCVLVRADKPKGGMGGVRRHISNGWRLCVAGAYRWIGLCDAGHSVYEPFTHLRFLGWAVLDGDHLTLSAQYAADMGPLEMFLRWRDLNASRCPAVWLVRTPCCPKRMVLTCPPERATTMWDLVGCPGVRLGLL